jgi:hypothetical protein
MECQTDKWEELYAEQAVYSKAFPANGTPYTIGNNQSIDGKLRAAVCMLSHGRCRGALGIRAEHIKAWLRGVLIALKACISREHKRKGCS